jgi:hypothetical protein
MKPAAHGSKPRQAAAAARLHTRGAELPTVWLTNYHNWPPASLSVARHPR